MLLQDMVVGARYNWRNQPARLIYMGVKHYPNNGHWHQFAKVEEPFKCWSEVLPDELKYFEETKGEIT